MVLLLIACVFLAGIGIGTYERNANAYATTGSLISKNGVWYGGAENGASITVNWSGWYKITVGAEEAYSVYQGAITYLGDDTKGNTITAQAYFSAGDMLTFRLYNGGTTVLGGGSVFHGGAGALILQNNTPLVGAGGSYYTAHGTDKNGVYGVSGYVTGGIHKRYINNNEFGGGASGMYCAGGKNPAWYPTDMPQTYAGLRGASYVNGVPESGANYLDTSRATLISQDVSAQQTPYFRVEAIPNTVDDSYDAQISTANTLKTIASYQASMVQKEGEIVNAIKGLEAGGGGGNSDIPTITVCQNETFNVVCGYYDDMQGGSASGVTVENSNVGDGVVVVKGRMTTVGTFKVTINGKKFCINVVSPPTPNSVTAILN